ncbi:uncharacterized protein LOC144359587 [Saccoglossus kowalevskii]
MTTGLISINSVRLQRAKRINELEAYKLDERLRIIEKSKKCIMATVNNDIRLIQEDFSGIQISSGKSPEGRPPEEEIRERERKRRYRRRLLRKRMAIRRNKRLARSGSISDDDDDDDDISLTCPSDMSEGSERYPINTRVQPLRPQTAPGKLASRNRTTENRPSTVTHPRQSNLKIKNKIRIFREECLNGNDESREKGHSNHRVAFALRSPDLNSVEDDQEESNWSTKGNTFKLKNGISRQNAKKSLLAKQANLDADEPTRETKMQDRRMVLPPDLFHSSEMKSRKNTTRQFREPRAVLLREESRGNLLAQVGEEDLTKALARHMSRSHQRDPTSATHSSRQRSIRGFNPNQIMRRSVAEMPGTLTRTEEKDVRVSVMKF